MQGVQPLGTLAGCPWLLPLISSGSLLPIPPHPLDFSEVPPLSL